VERGFPSVSIIIPAYNHADYLARAIDSVLAQDYPVELIVLDDGSTDATHEVLAKHTGRFYWETHSNIGQAATLNKGWQMSRGEILGYLSADDFLLPGAVRLTVAALQRDPGAVVAYCDFELVDPNGKVIRYVRAADFSLEDMLRQLACPPGPGALFRRSAFEATGGWNPALRLMADFEYWLRLALLGKFVRIPRALAAWRVHNASQSFARMSPENASEPVRIISEYFARPEIPRQLLHLEKSANARACLVSAQLHARSGRYASATAMFYQGCIASPRVIFAVETWRLVANAFFQQPAQRLLWSLRQHFEQ
jgi:glycosyltransferase involved in cell wall biosynthesis